MKQTMSLQREPLLKSYLNWATDEAKQLCLQRETNAQIVFKLSHRWSKNKYAFNVKQTLNSIIKR